MTGESHPKKGQEGGEARTFRSVAIFIDDGAEEKLNRVSQKGSLNEVRSSSKKTESEWISFLLSFTSSWWRRNEITHSTIPARKSCPKRKKEKKRKDCYYRFRRLKKKSGIEPNDITVRSCRWAGEREKEVPCWIVRAGAPLVGAALYCVVHHYVDCSLPWLCVAFRCKSVRKETRWAGRDGGSWISLHTHLRLRGSTPTQKKERIPRTILPTHAHVNFFYWISKEKRKKFFFFSAGSDASPVSLFFSFLHLHSLSSLLFFGTAFFHHHLFLIYIYSSSSLFFLLLCIVVTVFFPSPHDNDGMLAHFTDYRGVCVCASLCVCLSIARANRRGRTGTEPRSVLFSFLFSLFFFLLIPSR